MVLARQNPTEKTDELFNTKTPNSPCHFKKKKKYSAAAYSAASQRCLSVLMCVSSAYGREAVKLWLWQNLNNSCCWPNYGTCL